MPEDLGKSEEIAKGASYPTPPEVLEKIQRAKETGATELNLSSLGLMAVPPELAQLQNLTSLSLSGNKIKEIPEHLSHLQNLTSLYLLGNELKELPEHLSRLQKLTSLDLGRNELKDLPEHLSRLQKLTSLSLWGNQLKEIPEHLSRLQKLTSLNLSHNELKEIPEHLSRLQKLTWLNLSHNELKEIPEYLSRLQKLIWLNLLHNELKDLPEHLSRLQKLTSLDVGGNPIETPPYEVCERGIKAIRKYYRQQREFGTEKLYEAKLLIVGEAGAGKTTLANKIQNSNYQLKTEKSTEGIDIIRWRFALPDGIPFYVNIWDFGGQEIYHTTHQFFLTKRSCYVLVADNRKEDDNLYYWLSVVERAFEKPDGQ